MDANPADGRKTGGSPPSPRYVLAIACPAAFVRSLRALSSDEGPDGPVEVVALDAYPSVERLSDFLTENREDLVALAVGLRESAPARTMLEIGGRKAPAATLAAVAESAEDPAWGEAQRTGAKTLLTPPYSPAALRGLLLARRPRADSRLACFLPAQGGNGASTLALNTAARIAAEAPREGPLAPVLLLDLDFHSDSAAFWLNRRPAYTLSDALQRPEPSIEYWTKLVSRWNGVDLLAPPSPDDCLSSEAVASLPDVLAAAQVNYPWIVADLPAPLLLAARFMLSRAEIVYLVCTPEARSLFLARRRLRDLDAIGVAEANVRIVLNRAGSKRGLDAATAERALARTIRETVPNDYAEVAAASSERRLLAAHSAAGRQVAELARDARGVETARAAPRQGWRSIFSLG